VNSERLNGPSVREPKGGTNHSDLAVTFTDDRLNAQIQLRRTQNGLDRARSSVTSEQEQTAAQKRGGSEGGLSDSCAAKAAPRNVGYVQHCFRRIVLL
jgi:hypothetical protein